jgi:hypothetical protein
MKAKPLAVVCKSIECRYNIINATVSLIDYWWIRPYNWRER